MDLSGHVFSLFAFAFSPFSSGLASCQRNWRAGLGFPTASARGFGVQVGFKVVHHGDATTRSLVSPGFPASPGFPMSYLSPGVATPSDGGRHPFTPSRAYPDDEAARGPPPAPPSRAAPRPPGGVNVTVAAALPFPQVQGDPVMWQTGVWTAFERDLAVWLDTARCTGVETVGFISFTDAVRQTMLELAKGEQVATASALMLTNDELLRLARARAARRPVEQWPALFAGPSPLAPFEAADAVGFTTVLRRVHDTLKRGGCDLRQVRGRGARAFVEMLVHERAAFYVPNPRVRLLMQLVLEMACPLSLDIPTTFTWDVYVDALASPAFSALLDAAARNQAIVTTTQLAASQRRALRAELPSLAPAAPTALPEPAATTTLRHSAPSEGAAGRCRVVAPAPSLRRAFIPARVVGRAPVGGATAGPAAAHAVAGVAAAGGAQRGW